MKDMTIYNFIYSEVPESPDALDKLLKRLVGAKGFEPSTSWSRTRRASQAALRPDGGDLAIRVGTEYACQRDSQINTRCADWATHHVIIAVESFKRCGVFISGD